MTRTIRQHFVPRAYLRNFASTSPNSGVERAWTLITRNARIVEVPLHSVASRALFYDLGPDDHEQVLEKYFSQEVEGDLAALLREVVAHFRLGNELDPKHKRRLAEHMAMQYLRTSTFREALRGNLERLGEVLGRLAHHVVEGAPPDLQLVPNVEARTHLLLGLTDDLIATIAEILYRHAWRISQAPEGRSFMTNDAPVMLLGQPLAPWMGVGFTTYDAQVLFPISPEFLLHTTDFISFHEKGHEGENAVLAVPPELVDHYNFIIA